MGSTTKARRDRRKIEMLPSNLDKIVEHGQRADDIVRNMLVHSREGSGEHRPVDLNALVEEASTSPITAPAPRSKGFNITLERS